MQNKNEAFIRWQARTIEQMGFLNNLLIFLSTGMLALQIQVIIRGTPLSLVKRCFLLFSTLFIFSSIIVGSYLAWNRLNSFRITAKIARQKNSKYKNKDDIAFLREKVKKIDTRTWNLIKGQIISFSIGSFLLLVFAILFFF